MATERVREQSNVPHPTRQSAPDIEQPHRQEEKVYRLGPDDLQEFVALGEEGQRRLVEIPGALEAWLADHAAKYA